MICQPIRNKTLYKLIYGQKPREGISGLPISKEVLNKISTKQQLNQIFNILEYMSLDQYSFKLIQNNRQYQHYLLNYQKNKTTQYLPFEEEENKKKVKCIR